MQISDVLKTTRVNGSIFTHVSMFNPKGKYQMDRNTIDKFWDIYSDNFNSKKTFMYGLAEKPQHYLPILVDVDIKINENDFRGETVYKQSHISSLVEIYQSIIRSLVEDCSEQNLICFVSEKPAYTVAKNEVRIIKNGFHIHFPNTILSKIDQEISLIPKIRQKCVEMQLFNDILPNGKIDNIIDASYTKNPWLMYGCRKDNNQNSYIVSKAFDSHGEIDIEDAIKECVVYNKNEIEIEKDSSNLKYYLPRILSILPFGRQTSELVPGLELDAIENIPMISSKKPRKNNNMSRDDEICLAAKFVNILSSDRADSYQDWMTIGWALFNISDGCREGLDIWLEFSSKCEDKFNEKSCIYEWGKMVKKDMTIGTIKHFAKIDNLSEYQNIIFEQMKPYIDNSLSGSHNDIAKALYEMYSDQFTCSSINYKTWYEFSNNRWNTMEDGVGLRSKISDDIVVYYEQIGKDMFSKLAATNDEAEKAMYNTRIKQVQKVMNNLKCSPFKSNIMKESMEVFFNPKFIKKLDTNCWTIGFKNGVYDLKANTFREGHPTDYISMQMGIDYNPNFSNTDPMVMEVYDFLEKIFPDKSVRDYFLDTSCEVFVGGNHSKFVILWSGEGDNGKSVTQTLFEKMLGDYSIKLPTSLLVGKRTQASSACPELARAGNGVRWAVLQEPDQKDVINIGIMKELSGNDTFFARGLYKEGTEITPMFKLVLICNEPPKLPYNDKAAWNRIRVIPFESTFCDDAPATIEEQMKEKRFPKDKEFASKFSAGLTEAFAWVLLQHRQKTHKRVEPDKVKMATASYRRKNDIYRQFVEECLIESEKSFMQLSELYSQFKEWFRDSLPGNTVPIKNDVKEYFMKYWGEAGNKGGIGWYGYRTRTIKDDVGEDANEEGSESGDESEDSNAEL